MTPCRIPPDHDPDVIRTVHRVGLTLGVSDKVMLAAFEAGWVESHMNNLDCGDKDSLGVFQQRPSQGWGTPEQIRDVPYAAERFFRGAMGVERRSPGLSAGRTAQEVQRSAHPDRYDAAEGKARALLREAEAAAAAAPPRVGAAGIPAPTEPAPPRAVPAQAIPPSAGQARRAGQARGRSADGAAAGQ
ncbi:MULTISPECIES: hypothetical protein [Streptomyces]|uniref:Uncharacterized protein n=2 Tax=Streptomyces TaxID=1883 RepID=A0A100Y9W3_9ACTN|nr:MULTISPECIES: hypothetical protein [Streptomyces]KUH40354.1 hypothetical protein ATE80_01795 [Streptomyces kanasensis]UUS29804.1 hypothetical protein NRO40_02445 [Streptomyces changanensis]